MILNNNYMFAEYNYDNFPIVSVLFSETISNENEFDQFLRQWLELYHNQKDYLFLFDTRKMNNIPFKYSIKMALFIKKLRKQPYHYLQKSLIVVNNNKIKKLLDFVFTMQSPVAPVYIWNTEELNHLILNEKLTQINRRNLTEDIIYIKPNQSFIPFL
tara:strand:+ start:1160 stop:1633 length:474 start_codon:yes stop_codon:yes gene_type:complete